MDTPQSTKEQEAVEQAGGGLRLALNAAGLGIRAWQRSLNLTGSQEFSELVNDPERGTLFLFWHNRIFPMMAAYRRAAQTGRELHALVSASRDGAQFSHFLESCGIRTVRGSSSRRGSTAARELVRIIESGQHVVISVDGPRGPCYEAQPGAAMLLQATGIRPCLLGAEVENCKELSSWDRFLVPMPGSRVKIKMDRSAPPSVKPGKEGRQAIQKWIQEKLMNLTADTHRPA